MVSELSKIYDLKQGNGYTLYPLYYRGGYNDIYYIDYIEFKIEVDGYDRYSKICRSDSLNGDMEAMICYIEKYKKLIDVITYSFKFKIDFYKGSNVLLVCNFYCSVRYGKDKISIVSCLTLKEITFDEIDDVVKYLMQECPDYYIPSDIKIALK
jgi:hypothetical protein